MESLENLYFIFVMRVEDQLEKMKMLHSYVLDWLGKVEDIEEHSGNLFSFIDKQNIKNSGPELKMFLHLLSKIAKNHHRTETFFDQIFKILDQYKTNIQKFFSNSEIFKIFKSNKRILLFLFDEDIISFDESIYRIISDPSIKKYKQRKYLEYFYPEIKQFKGENIDIPYFYSEEFINKRKEGINHQQICEIIREDSLEKFKNYISVNNLSLDSEIKPSIFETNHILIVNKTNLIEYATFYGSVEIFNYLVSNGVKLTDSLWQYAVHNNSNIFSFLEKNLIKNKDQERNKEEEEDDDDETESFPFKQTVIESIKCHNNDLANHLLVHYKSEINKMPKLGKFEYKFDKYIVLSSFRFYNAAFFPEKVINNDIFMYLCNYDYLPIVKVFLSRKFDIDDIYDKIFFNFFFIKFKYKTFKYNFKFLNLIRNQYCLMLHGRIIKML